MFFPHFLFFFDVTHKESVPDESNCRVFPQLRLFDLKGRWPARFFCTSASGSSKQRAPHIVVGITHSQTCLTLTERLRALREAGFRVTLVLSPGDLLNRIAEREGIESIAIPIQREIGPIADLRSLVRLCWLLIRLRPEMTEFSTRKPACLARLPLCLQECRNALTCCAGLRLRAPMVSSAAFCWWRNVWPQPAPR